MLVSFPCYIVLCLCWFVGVPSGFVCACHVDVASFGCVCCFWVRYLVCIVSFCVASVRYGYVVVRWIRFRSASYTIRCNRFSYVLYVSGLYSFYVVSFPTTLPILPSRWVESKSFKRADARWLDRARLSLTVTVLSVV